MIGPARDYFRPALWYSDSLLLLCDSGRDTLVGNTLPSARVLQSAQFWLRRRKVAVPRFNYELSPARKDRHVVSLILHVVAIILFIKLAPLIPSPQFEPRRSNVTL